MTTDNDILEGKKIKDINDFAKLLKINIPNRRFFEYYLKTLSRSLEFSDILENANKYAEAEEMVENTYGKSLHDFRHSIGNKVIDFLKGTAAYSLINKAELQGLPTNKDFTPDDNKIYVSMDLKHANFQAFKEYDSGGELPNTYEELLAKFNAPEIIIKSKYFRQVIFGNTNPKRLNLIERYIIERIKNIMEGNHNIAAVRSDELIFHYNVNLINDINNLVNYPVKYTIFKQTGTEQDGVKIREILNEDLSVKYKKLSGAHGHRFYIYFKRFILNEPICLKDLYFQSDGHLAVWADEYERLYF